ncbi:MAG: hypothetical protein ACRETD_10905, partial [Steroidobacteraceae bacterium]
SLQRAIDVVAALRIANDSNLPRYYAYLSDAQQHALDLADAERNARIALKRIQAINGDAPADTAYFQMRLGKLLWRTGRPREGIALLTRAEQFALQSGKGGDPQQVLWARYMRGVALARSGALAEGLNELRSAIAVCRQTQPDAVFLAEFLEETAYALTQTGGYDEAARLLAEAQQIRLDHKQHPGTPEFQANIAARVRLELAQAHVPQARSLFDDMRTQPGLAPLSWQQIEHDLLAARIALAQGQEDAAATHAAQVRARIEQAGLAEYLKEPLAQADLIGGLAALRKQQSSDALRLLQSALALRQQGLLASSPKIIQAQVALATAWLATGANAKAQALTASAAASAAQQTLGAQYGEPLRQLRASLQH